MQTNVSGQVCLSVFNIFVVLLLLLKKKQVEEENLTQHRSSQSCPATLKKLPTNLALFSFSLSLSVRPGIQLAIQLLLLLLPQPVCHRRYSIYLEERKSCIAVQQLGATDSSAQPIGIKSFLCRSKNKFFFSGYLPPPPSFSSATAITLAALFVAYIFRALALSSSLSSFSCLSFFRFFFVLCSLFFRLIHLRSWKEKRENKNKNRPTSFHFNHFSYGLDSNYCAMVNLLIILHVQTLIIFYGHLNQLQTQDNML